MPRHLTNCRAKRCGVSGGSNGRSYRIHVSRSSARTIPPRMIAIEIVRHVHARTAAGTRFGVLFFYTRIEKESLPKCAKSSRCARIEVTLISQVCYNLRTNQACLDWSNVRVRDREPAPLRKKSALEAAPGFRFHDVAAIPVGRSFSHEGSPLPGPSATGPPH
jgi:hypothetical protein